VPADSFPPAAAQFPPENQCQNHLISCEAVKCLILFKCKWLMGNTAS